MQSSFSHAFLLLSFLTAVVQRLFSPLKFVITEVLPLLLALANGGSTLELPGIRSVRHRERFWQFLTEDTPVGLSTTKILTCKPIQGEITYLSVKPVSLPMYNSKKARQDIRNPSVLNAQTETPIIFFMVTLKTVY